MAPSEEHGGIERRTSAPLARPRACAQVLRRGRPGDGCDEAGGRAASRMVCAPVSARDGLNPQSLAAAEDPTLRLTMR